MHMMFLGLEITLYASSYFQVSQNSGETKQNS